MTAESQYHAERTAQQADGQELADKQRPKRPLANTEAAHGGAAVQMTASETIRGHRDSNGREHGGEERHEREKVTGAIDGLAHLRFTVLQRFEPDAAQLAAV